MVVLSVDVPAEQVRPVLRALLLLYRVKCEALCLAIDGYLDDPGSLRGLLDHRRELTLIDDLIDEVGWALEPRTQSRTLTGEPALLGEILESALLRVIDTIRDALAQAPAEPPDLVLLARLVIDAQTLLGLLARVRHQELIGTAASDSR